MPGLRFVLASLVIIGVAAPRSADAGIVNVQSALATDADEGVSGAVTGSADWRTGNVDLLMLSAAPVVRYRSGAHMLIGIGKVDFGKTGEPLTTFIKRTFAHVRYRYRVNPRLVGEVFAQHSLDEFVRLSTRALFGVGPKFDLVNGKKYDLDLGVAYMLEYERLSVEPGLSDSGDDDLANRASSYLSLRIEIDDRLELVDTAYVQPRLTDFADVRLLNETTFSVKINDRLSFATSFVIAHDRAPPETVEETDTALKSSVTVSF